MSAPARLDEYRQRRAERESDARLSRNNANTAYA